MTDIQAESYERSYGCSMGCGNPYDFVVVTIEDGSTLFLCVPCFIRIAAEMTEAVVNPDNPAVQDVVADNPAPEQVPHTFDPIPANAAVPQTPQEQGLCPDCGNPDGKPHAELCAFRT